MLELLQLSRVEWLGGVECESIILGTLTDLRLTYEDAAWLSPLRGLSLPQLTHLHLHLLSNSLAELTSTFLSWLHPVQFVVLRLLYITPEDLLLFFHALPNLYDLDITKNQLSVFRWLMDVLQSDEISLPRLHVITTRGPLVPGDIASFTAHFGSGSLTIYERESWFSTKEKVWTYADGKLSVVLYASTYLDGTVGVPWTQQEYGAHIDL
ncbi:hypothetical protein B0H12DRAFT_1243378 [Mycena haematopus]|nr:hypothetical protein B0H12DRAFT_1243378 [Mycena haematopus]